MLLIIAHHYDAEAQWLYNSLKRDYNLPVYLLIPEALGVDYSISLHLDNNGAHYSQIFFYNPELSVKSHQWQYVINRLSYIDPITWRYADPVEKTYATHEINAFYPALIRSFTCPVSNSIHNGALFTGTSFTAKWAVYLYHHGTFLHPLATESLEEIHEHLNSRPASDIHRLMFFNNELIVPPGQQYLKDHDSLRLAISRKAEDEILEFIFLTSTENLYQLILTNRIPLLIPYGQKFIDALLHRMREALNDNNDRHTKRDALEAAR